MKRSLLILFLLLAALLIACNGESEHVEPPAVEVTPAPTAQPVEPTATAEPEEDVVSVPVTEWIVTAQEGEPDPDALEAMPSLRLLDLTALPYTPFSVIETYWIDFPNLTVLWNQMLTDGVFRSDSEELALPHATEEDVRLLEVFGNLRAVDASGSTAYQALAAYANAHPNVAVHYTLTVGEATIDETSESLSVPSGTDAAWLTNTLRAFPNLQEIDLRGSGWSDAEISSFVSAFPNISVHRLITVGALSFDSDAELIDLRETSGLSADDLIQTLSAFPHLNTVALPKEMGENDASAIRTAFPNMLIVGPVSAFGRTFEGGTEEIDLSNTKMTGTEEVEALLNKLPFLKTAVLCDCELSNEQMEALKAAHPDVKFVWTIVIGKRKLRTDAIGFSTKNPSKYTNPNSSDAYNQSVKKAVRLYEGDIEALKYCTDLEALDLGHNYLTNNDLEVIAGLTKLKILILADNKITDISALTTLKNLEYIELFMNKIPDLSPLTEMPALVDVNVCNTGVSDLSPLFELTGVKRLWYAMNPFSRDQATAVKAALPDCQCNYTTRDETGEGWRDNERYHWMRSYFK